MRRCKLALDLLALVGLLLLLANPAAAAPPPARPAVSPPSLAANPLAPRPTPTTPGVRPKAAAPTATATAGGPAEPSSGEIVALRTRTSRTYATADGNEAFLYSESVNYQPTPGAAWQKIDNSLVASGMAYHNAANRYALTVPGSLGQGPVKLQVGASWLTLSLSGASASAAASVSGNAATFANALPGANLVIAAGGDAVEAALALTAATAPASYTFSLTTSSDLSVEQQGNAISVVVIATGQPLLTIPPASMADSSGSTAGVSSSVTQTLATAPGGATLTVSADPAYLASPARVYPVTIDPSVTLSSSPACRIETDFPNQGFCGSFLRAGYNGSTTWRALLQFDLSGVPADSVVLDAELNLDAYAFGSGNAMVANLQQVTTAWTGNVSWNTDNGTNTWHTAGGDFLTVPVWSQTVLATVGWNSWGLSQLVQGWVDGGVANDGVLLKEAVETQVNTQDYHGDESLFPADKPTMTVLYAPYLGDGPSWYTLQRQPLSDRMGAAVNLEDGNLVLHQADVAINGTAGFNLLLDRWYNSLADELGSPGSDDIRDLGVNWVMDDGFDVRLHPGKDGEAYYGPGGFAVHFQRQQNGSFTSPPGIDATLAGNNPYTLTFHQTGVVYTLSHPSSQGGDILLTSMADQNGNTVTFNYVTNEDALASIVDSQNRTITPTYTNGYLTKLTDWTGRSWQYTIDANNDLTQYVDPANGVTKYSYDPYNHADLTLITDPKGNQTEIVYDTKHRVSQITFGYQSNPDVHGTYGFTYNTGNTVVTDPNNHQTTYSFGTVNDTSLLTKVTDPLSNSFQYSYNSDNHVYQYTDAKNQVFTSNYDVGTTNSCSTAAGTNNLCSVVLPTGAIQSWQYQDSAHPYYPTSFTDAQGHTVSYSYSTAGNLATITDQLPSQNEEQLIYNSNGTLNYLLDFDGNRTSFGYDTAGNLTSITPPTYSNGTQLGATGIAPDSLSRPHTITDGKKQQRQYAYDALDRVTALTYPADTAGNVSYAPDADGDVTSMTDGTGTTTYTYDARNRQTKKTLPNTGYFSYGYDPKSNLTSLTDAATVLGQGLAVSYGYNAGDELSTLADPGGQTAFTSDPNHFRATTTYPDGTVMTETRDNAERLSSIVAKNSGGTTLTSFTYSYTTAGRDTLLPQTVAEVLTGVGNATVTDASVTNSYDALNRLTKWLVTNTGTGATIHDYVYQYDGNSNRTQIVADPINASGQIVSDPSQGIAHSNENDLVFNAANELYTIQAYSNQGVALPITDSPENVWAAGGARRRG